MPPRRRDAARRLGSPVERASLGARRRAGAPPARGMRRGRFPEIRHVDEHCCVLPRCEATREPRCASGVTSSTRARASCSARFSRSRRRTEQCSGYRPVWTSTPGRECARRRAVWWRTGQARGRANAASWAKCAGKAAAGAPWRGLNGGVGSAEIRCSTRLNEPLPLGRRREGQEARSSSRRGAHFPRWRERSWGRCRRAVLGPDTGG